MDRIAKISLISFTAIIVLLLCNIPGALADTYIGGQPLTTVQTGTVSGGLWYDAVPPTFDTSVTKDFALPAEVVSGATWARLYVSTYNGHMQDQRHGSIAITWDNDADSVIEETWTEDLDVPFVYKVNGGNDNTGEGGGLHDPYKIVNDHCNRVTSDYFMWYDVKDLGLLTSGTVRVNAVATAVGGSSFDGRIKEVALVVAYDDGDSDYIRYWVNQGHDVCSYYPEDNYHVAAVGSTTFATTGFDSVDSATLTSIYMASNNGYYGFPTKDNTFIWTGGTPPVTGTFTNFALDNTPDVQGSYSGVDSWDVTSSVTGSAATTLGYARYFPATGTAAFYKIPLALLTVKGTELEITDPPDAEFSADPTSGDPPLTVQFTDLSTNLPNQWFWEFGDEENSEDQNPSHEYVRPGTYTVSLTAYNIIGDDTETKTDYITVSSIWGAESAWGAPDAGVRSRAALADLDNDGDYDLMVGESAGVSKAYENTGSVSSPVWTARSGWNIPDVGTYSSPAFADLDNDGDFDVLVGVPGGTCIAYENTGSATSPAWTARPGWNAPDAGSNSAPAFADLDNDGDYDLMVGESAGVTKAYENTGSATSPTWTARTGWNTPDAGANSVPAFADIDWDGDFDLLIGESGSGEVFAYENTGSASSPVWGAKPAWDMVVSVGTYAAPCAADLDNDGNYDLLVGSNAGTSSAFKNIAPPPTACDLTISGIVNVKSPSVLFAREPNSIVINSIKNNGPGTSAATEVLLTSSDGFSARAAVPSLAKDGVTTITITDTTIRDTAGGSVTYTATLDPDNTVIETDEANNVKTSAAKTVTYNGYKGKRYWAGQSDVTTRDSFDLHGGLVYSFGDSVYRSGSFGSGWTTFTVTWTAADLPIPAGATVREARLYVPYTWDNSNEAPDDIQIDFNTAIDLPYRDWYHDVSNFGAYYDHVYGLLTYDVTTQFQKNGVNTAVFTRQGSLDKISPYGFTLAVVYEDATATRKQIFLNEEFDLLGASEGDYATSEEEATAYIPFSGQTIVPADVASATLITFVPSGESNEGDLLFNGETIASDVWDYGSTEGTQVAVDTREVKNYLTAGTNEAGIRATARPSPCLAAAQQFLVVEYSALPVIEVTLGSSSATLTNMIAGQDATGSTTVNVVASDGSSWSVSASDGKTTNKGYMVSGSTPLANPFQLGKDGSGYQALTSDYTGFMSGTTMGVFSATASFKQPIVTGDAVGDYSITVTFTGSIS
ncbi:MAG: FG-GAP repeat protein [Methanocella sp. PtaU1.Bin125]|nr:MAG: FG-GAP repeat protein [Methanocella sp. PtaU1.Bin125]